MVELLFAFINFGIVTGLFVFIVVRYLAPALKDLISEEKTQRQSLHDEHSRLTLEQSTMDERIRIEQDECRDFSLKVDRWKRVVESQVHEREEERKRLLLAYEKEMKKKMELHMLSRTYQKVKSLVVASLKKDLSSQFEDEKALKTYREQILNELNV